MKIILARNSGFCFGVRRAVEMAEQCAKECKTVYTYGNIIHNDSVVRELAEKGVHSVEHLEKLGAGDTLIIRAHGAPPSVYEECEAREIRLIDATCPYVKRIHKIVNSAASQGSTVLIAGKADHPEVIGIRGWAGANAFVLESEADVANLPTLSKAVLVAQTTLPDEMFDAIENVLKQRMESPDSLEIRNTICDTTRDRQNEAEEISRRSTRMFVLGSKSSANTQKLVEISKKHCKTRKTSNPARNFCLIIYYPMI